MAVIKHNQKVRQLPSALSEVRTWHARLCSNLAYVYSSYILEGQTARFHANLYSINIPNQFSTL